ncbi:MAG: hypothetical protein ABI446_08075 [Gemmatimonadaceae bacterium]
MSKPYGPPPHLDIRPWTSADAEAFGDAVRKNVKHLLELAWMNSAELVQGHIDQISAGTRDAA